MRQAAEPLTLLCLTQVGRGGRRWVKTFVFFSTETLLYSLSVPPDCGSIPLYWKTNKQNENPRKLMNISACVAIRKWKFSSTFSICTKGQQCCWLFFAYITSLHLTFWLFFLQESYSNIFFVCVWNVNHVFSSVLSLSLFNHVQLYFLTSFPLFFLSSQTPLLYNDTMV